MKRILLLLISLTIVSPVIGQTFPKSDLVLVVEVEGLQTSTGLWSGFLMAGQDVNYRVIEVLKGKLDAEGIDVGFLLVWGSNLADPNEPRLSAEIFKPGNRHLLFLNNNEGKPHYHRWSPENSRRHYFAADQFVGIILAGEETIDMARRIYVND